MADWQDKLAQIAQQNRMDIVKAKLSRREMMRLGLLTASGGLALKSGLSARAFAQTAPINDLTTSNKMPPSPPTRPWVAPMPILPVKQPIAPEDCRIRLPGRHHADRRRHQADQPSVLQLQLQHAGLGW